MTTQAYLRVAWVLIGGTGLIPAAARAAGPVQATAQVRVASSAAVTASQSDRSIVMDNGIVGLTVDRRSSNVTSIRYHVDGQDKELGAPGRAMYFDSNGQASDLPPDLAAKVPKAGYFPLTAYVQSVDLVSSTPDSAEVVAKGGPTDLFPFGTDVHYVLRRGMSGFYAYVVFHHDAASRPGSVGQTRFVVRGPVGPGLYTDHAVDDARKGPVDYSPDVRAVSDATYLMQDGKVYCKYDNTAFMASHYFHGMTGHGVGLWMVTPSNEYVNGGPTKQELTVHKDNTLLSMLDGGHFGAGAVDVAQGEVWTKLYGPFLVYANSGPTTDSMFDDARRQATAERAQWPYKWMDDPSYPIPRGAVTGKIRLTDGEPTAGAWVVLAAPGGDWPMQAKGYEFWAEVGKDGSFTVPKVRPGNYALYAYGANQFEQFEQDGIGVAADKTTDVGTLRWTPVKHGRQLWQIGVADRSTQEFKDGQDNWGADGVRHWANFMRYPTDFPNDVTFTIGKSQEDTDWNYAQWTWYCQKPYWSIDFALPSDGAGTATLTFGIAAANPLHSHTNTVIKVNGTQVGELQLTKSGAAAYRSGGEDSLYRVLYITFDASLLKAGANEITLGDTDAVPFPTKDVQMDGKVGCIMYDAIRLEVGPAH